MLPNPQNLKFTTWKPNGLTLLLMILAPLSLLAYFYLSQYYYPSNYIEAQGKVINIQVISNPINHGQNTAFYYIQFSGQNGQLSTYKYEAPPSSYSEDQLVSIHYNKNDPAQVRVKPPALQLVDQAIVLVVLPFGILFIVKLYGAWLRGGGKLN